MFFFAPISAISAETPKFSEEFSAADTNLAVKNIAAILLHMEHYVESHEKKMLKQLVKNQKVSHSIRTIAEAIVNIQHKPLYEDIGKLQEVYQDDTSSVSEQELAYIVMNFRYKPTTKDKSTLKAIIQ